MPNYSMTYGVSEMSRILKIDRDTIKLMAFTFSEYLQPKANPLKGNPRLFCKDDIPVLAFISYYWEESPDIECIKSGLKAHEQLEYPFSEFIAEVSPMFIVPPDSLDENSNGIIFGGLAEFGDAFYLADSFKLAGDMLVNSALANDEKYELICPVLYNYRHATELYLKATIGESEYDHKLIPLLDKLKHILKTEFDTFPPEWFDSIIHVFNDFDERGTTFRYGSGSKKDEVYIDLMHVKTKMGMLAESFQKIKDSRIEIK